MRLIHVKWAFFRALLLYGTLAQVSPRPFKRPSSVYHSPMQVGWTSKLHVLGTCLSGAGLKIWGAWCGTNSLLLWEKLWVFTPHHPPIMGCCAGHGYHGKIVSQPFLPAMMCLPSHLLKVKGLFCQYLGFLQRKSFRDSCGFSVSVRGVEFGIVLRRHLPI